MFKTDRLKKIAVNGPYGLCSEAVEWSIDVLEICVVRDSSYLAL